MRLACLLLSLLPALAACTTADTSRAPWHGDLAREDCCLDIAHAAGALDGAPYTNSIQALRSNAAQGRRLFEVDMALTSDHHLVLAHDWDRFAGQAPSLAEFRAQTLGYTPTDTAQLLRWMQDECTDCMVITDAKDSFDAFWPAFTKAVPKTQREARFIVQTYSFAQSLQLAAQAPQQAQILTLYRQDDLTQEDLSALRGHPSLLAVTMPLNRVPAWAKRVTRALGVPVYTHAYPWMMKTSTLLSLARAHGVRGYYME